LKKGTGKKIIIYISPLFIIFSLFIFFASPNDNIDSLTISVEYILIITYCLVYFFQEINHPEYLFIYSSPSFWVIVSILIYSTGTFFLFTYSDNLNEEQWQKWSIINYVFTIIKNLLFGIAMILFRSNNNKPPFSEKPYLDHILEKPYSNIL